MALNTNVSARIEDSMDSREERRRRRSAAKKMLKPELRALTEGAQPPVEDIESGSESNDSSPPHSPPSDPASIQDLLLNSPKPIHPLPQSPVHTTEESRRWKAEPVICTLLPTDENAWDIPAVRVQLDRGQWALFPLSLMELGAVWNTPEHIRGWSASRYPHGWDRALEHFKTLVPYPDKFLSLFLHVLRTGTFLDRTPIRLETWQFDCKNDPHKLGAQTRCIRCGKTHLLAPRWLACLPSSLDTLVCPMVQSTCIVPAQTPAPLVTEPHQADSDAEELFLGSTSRRTRPRPSLHRSPSSQEESHPSRP